MFMECGRWQAALQCIVLPDPVFPGFRPQAAALHMVIEMGKTFADSEPFLHDRECLPGSSADLPFHQPGDLTGIQSGILLYDNFFA